MADPRECARLLLTIGVALLQAGCASDERPGPAADPTATPAPTPTVVVVESFDDTPYVGSYDLIGDVGNPPPAATVHEFCRDQCWEGGFLPDVPNHQWREGFRGAVDLRPLPSATTGEVGLLAYWGCGGTPSYYVRGTVVGTSMHLTFRDAVVDLPRDEFARITTTVHADGAWVLELNGATVSSGGGLNSVYLTWGVTSIEEAPGSWVIDNVVFETLGETPPGSP